MFYTEPESERVFVGHYVMTPLQCVTTPAELQNCVCSVPDSQTQNAPLFFMEVHQIPGKLQWEVVAETTELPHKIKY